MSERGVVTRFVDGVAEVALASGEGCNHCSHQGDCQVAGITIKARPVNGVVVAEGDSVEVVTPKGTQGATLLWLVALPLGLFTGGYLAGTRLFPGSGEGPAATLGLLGLGLGLTLAALIAKRGRLARLPELVRVLGPEDFLVEAEGCPNPHA